MAEASYTVTIGRPVADVFAYVADGERCPEWRPSVIDIGRVSGEGLGARYEQGVRGPKGRRIAADYEITVYDPNRRIEFQTVAGPVRPHGVYEFAEADGGTRLTSPSTPSSHLYAACSWGRRCSEPWTRRCARSTTSSRCSSPSRRLELARASSPRLNDREPFSEGRLSQPIIQCNETHRVRLALGRRQRRG